MPVTTLGDIVVFPHDSIGPPRHQMGDPDVDAQVASRAGVHLLCFRRTNGLHNVGITTLGLRASKPSLQAIDIQRFWLFSLTTAWSITPRHGKA